MRRSIAALHLLSSILTSGIAHGQPDDPPAEPSPPPADGEANEEEVDPDSEPVATEPLDDTGPDPARPAPPGKGVVWGVVSDTRYQEPLMEAAITVENGKASAYADLDGRFRLELPPGTYTIRVWYELHQATRLENVIVTAGQVSRIDVELVPDEGAVDVVEVETQMETESLEGQNLARKRAAATGDAIGRAEIAKTPDKNAAEAAKRVVGASIIGGRFVYVRGLGERYTNALLDGAPLPSPEPDRQTVPLDLFPSLMLDGITIAKTFTPDMPGDFAGGSVQITTRRIPEKFTFSVGASASINEQSTFQDRLTYDGGGLDWLGIDDGTRARPDLPDYKLDRGVRRPDGSLVDNAELTDAGKQLNSPIAVRRAIAPVDHSASLVIGNGFDMGGGKRLGLMAAVTYARSFEHRDDEIIRTFRNDPTSSGDLVPLNDLRVTRSVDNVQWGALLGATYQLAKGQNLHLTGIHSRSADDEVADLEGRHEERGARIHDTRLTFVSRALSFIQLRGEHELVDLDDADFNWTLFLSEASRDQPDSRGVVYQFDSAPLYAFEDDSLSGSHFFSEQTETTIGGGFDWAQPLVKDPIPLTLKIGSLISVRERAFDARRFRFRPANGSDPALGNCPGSSWDFDCPGRYLNDGNVGTNITLEETTQDNDVYNASLNVFAGYVMVDAAITERLRIILGERLETSQQSIDSFIPFTDDQPIRVDLEANTLLPSANVVFAATSSSNLRVSATRTLARPQLRELAPFRYTDYFGAREVEGNPDLQLTGIINGDVRFEYFPTLREVLAASVFIKSFDDPIEQVIVNAGATGKLTYKNAESATLFGVELEARKSFDIFSEALRDLSLVANFTFSRSRVQLSPEDAVTVTSRSRPLSNQAPFILNAAIDYDNEDSGTRARVLYNISGRRIVAVGTDGLADIYEQPRHQLDFTASQRIVAGLEGKLSVKNIIDDDVLHTQGDTETDVGDVDNAVRRYRLGRSYSVGLSYTY